MAELTNTFLEVYLIDLLISQDLRRTRVFRDRNNAFDADDSTFIALFRVTKPIAWALINELKPCFTGTSTSKTAITPELKVLCALNFYASGSYQRYVGNDRYIGLSQKSVSRCIREVTNAICSGLFNKWIKFPINSFQQNKIKLGFNQKFGFPGVIGAVDGTHVAIIAPKDTEECQGFIYINRKSFHSLNVQLRLNAVEMLRSSVPGKTSKVLICGYRSSGKTSILEQLIYGNFPCNAYPTIEDIYCALVNTDRGLKEKLRFYDTAGTVPGQSTDFLKTYMTYAEGVVLVYAINSRESFQLLDQVKKEYDKNRDKKEVPIIVLGNKMDLQNERQVDTVLAQAWAQKEKVKLYEVTAVDRRTLTEPFVYLASKMNPPPSKSSFPQLGKKGKAGSITMEL